MPVPIYADHPNWVQPWNHDIEAVFDTKKNKFFQHGTATRWILKNDQGALIGRIAAFINEKEAFTFDQPTGGMGFFECIDDQKAANLLMDTAKTWLQAKGMEAMDGPINFGERNSWWGLLVEGYEHAPVYQFNYHPPYYRNLLESYGFQVYYKQFCYSRDLREPFHERLLLQSTRLLKKKGYHFKTIDFKKLDYFIDALLEIYNSAWVAHETFKPLKRKHIENLFKQMKPIADPDVVLFAFYNEQPIAFFVCIPDINPIIQKLKGKFGLWSKLKFLYYQKRGLSRTFMGILYGIVPRYQGRGLTTALARLMQINAEKSGRYDFYEMGWLGDFNPSMLHIADFSESKLHKVYHTYRILFDPNKPFERRPIIGPMQKPSSTPEA